MAFLQKKPNISTSALLYTLSSEETLLIVGLGNPGRKYEGTRHNVGFAAVNDFARTNDFPAWSDKKSLSCQLSTAAIGGKRVVLAKPDTYMNVSGQAAKAVVDFYKLAPTRVLVVYDELALPFGQLRTRVGGSDAGHNGVRSLVAHIGPGFGRLRIGIANQTTPKTDSADFVLAKFSKEEQAILPSIYNEACVVMTELIFGELAAQTRSVL